MTDTPASQSTKTRPPLPVENPSEISVSEMVVGEHRWFGLKLSHRVLPCCRWCGVVQRADGQNKPCPGLVGVSLRAEAAHVGCIQAIRSGHKVEVRDD